MLAVVMVATLLPTQAFAANFYQDDNEVVYEKTWKCAGEDAEDKILEYCRNYVANERTDEYALRYFSFHPSIDWASVYPEQYKVMKEITKGITSDFEKVKAIAKWVSSNMTYDSTNDADGSLAAAGIPKWLRGACGQYADTALILLRLAGFPVKRIEGIMSGTAHAWNHVFIEGRWYFLDTTNWDYNTGSLMIPADFYSVAYYITSAPSVNWDGTLIIRRTTDNLPISTIGPLPIHTTIDKIPELKGMTLYMDRDCTKPVDPKSWKYDINTQELYVKTHRVSFEIQLDNAYKSLVPHYVREDEYGDLYAYVTVPEGEKLPQVKLPEKAGYTFIGWRDYSSPGEPFVNEDTDRVTKDMALIAVFKKGTVNYTVRFNTNGGSAVKAATVKANTKVAKPANPTKSGYKFTGWYLDKDCTEPWDFNTNIVRRNTTLYAGWEKVITANPTSSKVLVNGKAVTFEAYTIDGNNYFKLRDFAQAVNKTEKNFEVKWDSKNNAINLISNTPYTPVGGELAKGDGKAKVANPTTSKIHKDGKEISLTAYTINGNNYFKLRDIAKAFNIGVTWDGKTNTITIDTSRDYID
jgi:uncharacterized repeat protein (TIGR02543 family)